MGQKGEEQKISTVCVKGKLNEGIMMFDGNIYSLFIIKRRLPFYHIRWWAYLRSKRKEKENKLCMYDSYVCGFCNAKKQWRSSLGEKAV